VLFVNWLEWAFGAPQAQLDALPRGAIMRVGGGNFTTVGNNADTGLPVINENTAISISAINACVKLLAGAVSSLPMNIYTMDFRNGAKTQIWNDDLWWVLNESFHTQWPAAAGWDFMMRSRLYHGDAYAIIQRNGAGTVSSLKPVSKSRVITYEMENSRLVYAVLPDAKARYAETLYFDQDDMLHVPGDGFDGISSPSVLQFELRGAGGTALAAQNQAGRMYSNGMMPGFTLTSPDAPPPEAMEQMRQQLNDNYGGVRNSYKPMLLFGGMKAEALSVSPADAQLLESRKFQVEEVARIYGVPPFMIGHNEKTTSWGSGVEAMGAGFVRYTLRKHLHAFTNEFNRKLFPRGNRFCEFDTSDLERPSFKDFVDALRTAVGRSGERPIMTQNEARGRFNLPPVPGGDDMSPLNGSAATQEGAANE
jgi:HK97 family phage portal protein